MTDPIAWGAKVSPAFRAKVRDIASHLGCQADDLMACMAWESGRSFRPDVEEHGRLRGRRADPVHAVHGRQLGGTHGGAGGHDRRAAARPGWPPTSARTATAWCLPDLYMAILWPAAIGKALSAVLFDKDDHTHPARFRQNAGLDTNKDGHVTKLEAAARVLAIRDEGLRPLNAAA
jgi:hypothetical protein